MKNLIKKLTIGVLVAAIVLTGIVLPDGNAVTVEAKTTTGTFKDGSTITMKPGDKIKLLVTDTNHEFPNSERDHYDITTKYKWSSSDKNIADVETDFYSDKDHTQCIVIIATGIGTTTITGKCKSYQPDVKMTVKVTLPKPTAKQKKCKHKYKTTKSATCQSVGIKTCKKCKWQKTIAKKSHKYVDAAVYSMEYDKYVDYIECTSCTCPRVPAKDLGEYAIQMYMPECQAKGEPCDGYCPYKVCVQDYANLDEAFKAYESDWQHNPNNPQAHATWGGVEHVGIGKPHQVVKHIKECYWCGKEK